MTTRRLLAAKESEAKITTMSLTRFLGAKVWRIYNLKNQHSLAVTTAFAIIKLKFENSELNEMASIHGHVFFSGVVAFLTLHLLLNILNSNIEFVMK